MAQETQILHFSIGTGFFVSEDGYVLTSRHVIKECTDYSIFSGKTMWQATLAGEDSELDIALLKVDAEQEYTAHFNTLEIPLKEGGKLTTIGYPKASWRSRKPVIRKAGFVAAQGLRGESFLVQFSGITGNGNSGGPLIDTAGNVVGMVQARSTLKRLNTHTHEILEVKHVGVAVHPQALWEFLAKHGVSAQQAEEGTPLPQPQINTKIRRFTVNVRCQLD